MHVKVILEVHLFVLMKIMNLYYMELSLGENIAHYQTDLDCTLESTGT